MDNSNNINQKLLKAVQDKKLSEVNKLIKKGAQPWQKGIRDDKGYNVLMVAVEDRSIDIIKALLAKKPVATFEAAYSSQSHTALMVAAEKGFDDVVAMLIAASGKKGLKRNRRLNSTNVYGWNAFALAGINNHWNTMKLLKEAGIEIKSDKLMLYSVQQCDVNLAMTLAHEYQYNFDELPGSVILGNLHYQVQPFLITGVKLAADSKDKTLLAKLIGLYNKCAPSPDLIQDTCFYAVQHGITNMVGLLAPNVVNINMATQADGYTMLSLAIQLQNPGMVIELIRAGASCQNISPSFHIQTVFIIAAQLNDIHLMSLLLSYIRTKGQKCLNEAFIAAIKLGSDVAALNLIPEGISLDYVNEADENGVVLAGQYNCVNTIIQCFDIAQKKQLIARGANVFFEQALLRASRYGCADITSFLIMGAKINVECRDPDDNTPIILAAANGHAFIVAQLIQVEAFVNKANKFDDTAVMLATKHGHELIAAWLLKAGANSLKIEKQERTLLMLASQQGLLNLTKMLIQEFGLPVNQSCAKGLTALMYASIAGHTEVVKHLLYCNANIHDCDLEGKTAALHAFKHKKAGALIHLINAGSFMTFGNPDWDAIFKTFAKLGNIPLMTMILQNAPLDEVFMEVVDYNMSELIEPFLRLGANIHHARARDGLRAITLCAGHKDLKSFDLLLTHGASIDILENNSVTLMHVAAQCGNLLLLKRLFEMKAELVDRVSNSGHPPVFLAAQFDHTEVVHFLLKEGHSKFLTQTVNGDPLLHFSAYWGSYKIVKMLLELKNDLNMSNEENDNLPNQFDVNMLNQDGFSGLMMAAACPIEARNRDNLVRVAEVFIQNNIDLFLQSQGKNALRLALENDSIELACRIICAYPLNEIKNLLNDPQYKFFVEDLSKTLKDSRAYMFKILGSMWVDNPKEPAPFLSLPMELRAKILSHVDYMPWYAHRSMKDIELAVKAINQCIEERKAKENENIPPAVVCFSFSSNKRKTGKDSLDRRPPKKQKLLEEEGNYILSGENKMNIDEKPTSRKSIVHLDS